MLAIDGIQHMKIFSYIRQIGVHRDWREERGAIWQRLLHPASQQLLQHPVSCNVLWEVTL
jgi:hypothetical protein